MPAPFRAKSYTTAQAAKLHKLSAYQPGPSLYRDHSRSSLAAVLTTAAAELVATVTKSWAAHAAAGEYPVIAGREIEWRRMAQEVAA